MTEAVHHYKDSYPADFKKLMVELSDGEDTDYKVCLVVITTALCVYADIPVQVAFLTFINTMIVQGQSIMDRVRVREDFMAEGITDMLSVSLSEFCHMMRA